MNELHACLMLNRLPGIGSRTVLQWLEQAGTLENVFKADRQALARYGVTAKCIALLQAIDWKIIQPDLNWLTGNDSHHIITVFDAAYPQLLKEIPAPPLVLFVQGNIDLLTQAQIAIVGSRNPSPGGQDHAFEFARSLTTAGLIVTSGLALGIDAAAHRGALSEKGNTIAVLGTGLNRMYPAQHKALAQQIVVAGGTLISEFPIGSVAKPEHFPRRNRIISGLSLGTLVVEAALKSGSLITARYAVEQGREVFAIPGSIHNPLARGCHHLIRSGAKLVETAQDIIEELGSLAAVTAPSKSNAESSMLDEEYIYLMQHMDHSPSTIDNLVQRTGLKSGAIASMLLELELQGHIVSNAGTYCLR